MRAETCPPRQSEQAKPDRRGAGPPLVPPAGLGVGWIIQALPSQRSATVTIVPAPSGAQPKAAQAAADGRDTAETAPRGTVGLGVGSIVHLAAPAAEAVVSATTTIATQIRTNRRTAFGRRATSV
ncbi:MAG: hypothetical protein WBP81_00025 [Solirubrobacteraceae bacterium]